MNTKSGSDKQDLIAEVLDGLRQPQKRLPSKLFYDERGSELFEQITHLDEYYLTRTEMAILKANMEEIASLFGTEAAIVELGSGSSKKIRLLLDHVPEVAAYIPVDISEDYLLRITKALKKDYPELLIKPVCADYTKHFEIPPIQRPYERQVIFFPGSTLGNFEPVQAGMFLQELSKVMEPDGALLIGVDLKKDRDILERAYNDKKGVTAEFNKNILRHLSRELKVNANIDTFSHHAFYNQELGRIEMHLVSQKNQSITIEGEEVALQEGETIHTENSYKYSVEGFESLVRDWFRVKQVWTDEQQLYSLQYLVKR